MAAAAQVVWRSHAEEHAMSKFKSPDARHRWSARRR